MKLIGETSFQQGLQTYFKTYQMTSANFADFSACFGTIPISSPAPITVKAFMEAWLNEPGFPVIQFVKVRKDGWITLKKLNIVIVCALEALKLTA